MEGTGDRRNDSVFEIAVVYISDVFFAVLYA
jgi:hypothetical protein